MARRLPLGYILGDEGSGAVLGKLFLNGIFKGSLPSAIKKRFLKWSGLDYPGIINKVYREPLANRFLASICPFISEQIAEGGIEQLPCFLREQSHTLYPVCKSQSGGYLAVGTWRESLGFFFGRGDSDDRVRGKHRSLF